MVDLNCVSEEETMSLLTTTCAIPTLPATFDTPSDISRSVWSSAQTVNASPFWWKIAKNKMTQANTANNALIARLSFASDLNAK